MNWWPTEESPSFPAVGSSETGTCQPFVNTMIENIMTCSKAYIKSNDRTRSGKATARSVSIQLQSQPVDGHANVSYATRKPDLPCYYGDRRGGCAVTMVGDVKACGARDSDFPEGEVGHILDMAYDLMTKEQFTRTSLLCFLTDGSKFQFFRCTRRHLDDELSYEQSPVYVEEKGWQVSR